MLKVEKLASGYGDSQILFDVSFEIGRGEVVTLLGRNGMGKTTTIKTLFGLLPATAGSVTFEQVDLTNHKPHKIAQAGLGLVPEGRQVFPTLSVEENLIATARSRYGGASASPSWTLERVYELFPQLAERRRHGGHQLSGGEQQMLAIGRALMTNPSLLLLDEATEGLAPRLRETIWACLSQIKLTGVAILVIDKHIERLATFADRHIVIEKGRIVWEGHSETLLKTRDVVDRYLHV
ncbi:MAG: ABC transporter ATP-binding protein [Pseudomonadota bacterium]